MEHWGVKFCRFHGIEQRVQFFIFYLNQIQRLFRRLLGLCRDRGDLLTDKPNNSVCHNRGVIDAAADP